MGPGIRGTNQVWTPAPPHTGQNLLVTLDLYLSFQISLVTKSKRFSSRSHQSVLSVSAMALFPICSAFHLPQPPEEHPLASKSSQRPSQTLPVEFCHFIQCHWPPSLNLERMTDLSLAFNTSHSGVRNYLQGEFLILLCFGLFPCLLSETSSSHFCLSVLQGNTFRGSSDKGLLAKHWWETMVWVKADTRTLCALPKGRLPLSLQPLVGLSSCCCSSEFLTLSSSVSRLYKHNPYVKFSLSEIPEDVSRSLTD